MNWASGIIPGVTSGSSNPDTATFGSNTGSTFVMIDSGRLLHSLIFSGTDPLGLYTIGSAGINQGESLHLSSGGSLTMSPGTTTAVEIHAPLILEAASTVANGTYTIQNNSTNVANSPTDTNLYKLNLRGDISGGTTSGTITLNFAGTAGNRSSNASANLVGGLISDGGAAGGVFVTVTGSDSGNRGAWSFTNDANSYTGSTVIGGGTLLFTSIADSGVNSAIGAGSLLQLNSGAQAKYVGGAASSNRTILGSGGILYATGSGDLTLNGTFTLNGGITFRGGRNFIIDTTVTGSGGMGRTDGGTVYLNQVNTFNGNLSVQDGAFRFASIADKSQNSPIGAGTTITFGQNSSTVGRLEFTGSNGGSSNRDIVLSNGSNSSSGNGRIDNTVVGQTLALSGWVRSSSSNATHVSSLNLTGVGDGILSGVVGGTTGSPTTPNNMTLTKNGNGTWVLSNANHYYGPTNISAGNLLATNLTGSATGTGNVTTSGSGGLGGTGNVTAASGGSITIAGGSRLFVGTTHGVLSGDSGPAGTISGPGQFTLGMNADVALTLAGFLQFDLFGGSNGVTNGSADLLVLRTTATALTLGGTVSVSDTSGVHAPWRSGIWQLIDWAGTGSAAKTGGFTYDLPTASLASGYGYVTDDFLTNGNIRIEKVAANHTWTGASGSSWADTGNWEAGTLPSSSTDVFFASAPVVSHFINGDKSVRNLFFSGEADHTISTGSGGVLYSNGGYFEVLGGSQRVSAQLRVASGSVGTYRIVNDGTLRFDQAIMYHRTSGSGNLILSFSGSGDTTINHVQRRTNGYDVDLRFEGPGTVTFTGSTPTPASSGAGSITGTTTITGGKVRMNNELNLGSEPAAFNPGHLTIDGGTLAAYANFAINDANRGITLGSAGGTIEVEGAFALGIDSTITGPGMLTKAGTGALTLGGDNTYSGSILVNEGRLFINGNQGSATGDIIVADTAILGGTGTIGGDTTILSGGTVTGGSDGGIGTLAFSQDLTLASGSTWLVDLINDSTTADQLIVSGNLSLGGSLSIAESGAFVDGSIYTIATYGSLSGNGFANDLAYNGTLLTGRIDGSGGKYWTINYNDNGAITLTAVPEPGTLVSLLFSLLAGGWVARRRASASALDAEV
ncbi:MAG: autotransporter-associated beta strand repeat-containing protein [Verrucomicrobiae bacterium]|nr:autotransporter-associated beta strand repeat-containing protein [Verrucomicrobiae bacterium]